MRDFLRPILLLFGLPLKLEPLRSAADLALLMISQVGALLSAFAVTSLIDAVFKDPGANSGAGAGVGGAVVFLIACLTVALVAGWASFVVRASLAERTRAAIDAECARLMSAPPGIEHFERPDYLNKIEFLNEHRLQLVSLPAVLSAACGILVRLFVTMGLLASIDFKLLLLPLFAAPAWWAISRTQRDWAAAQLVIAPTWREQSVLFRLGADEPGGRELRIFGARPYLADRYAAIVRAGNTVLAGVNRQRAVVQSLAWAVFGLGLIGALVVIGEGAIAGRVTPGQLTLSTILLSQLSAQVSGLALSFNACLGGLETARHFLWVRDYAKAAEGEADTKVPAPRALREGIAFRNVSFRYAGSEREVLSGVDLTFPRGRWWPSWARTGPARARWPSS